MSFNGSILIVDDEPHIRKFVTLLVRQLGAPTIHEAADGEEALAIYDRERPALVLLDISMPLMDGLEALQRLRIMDPDATVIMLTSMANRQSVEQALEHGAVNYLRKDLPKDEMLKALAETIAAVFDGGEKP